MSNMIFFVVKYFLSLFLIILYVWYNITTNPNTISMMYKYDSVVGMLPIGLTTALKVDLRGIVLDK